MTRGGYTECGVVTNHVLSWVQIKVPGETGSEQIKFQGGQDQNSPMRSLED